jgi:hypothetical protein
MSSSYVEQFQVLQARPRLSGSRLGTIVAIEPGPIVDFPGNPLGPQRARFAASLTADTMSAACSTNLPVLLVFENDDPSRPVIIDVVVEHAAAASTGEAVSLDDSPRRDQGESHSTAPVGAAAVLARILGVEEGVVMVEDIAHGGPALAARTTIPLRNLKDPVVVLRFDDGSAVIVGQVYPCVPMEPAGAEGADVVLKGSRVRIEADVELVLTAGGCRVQLDARGKAVTTADQIVSRARGANKVQGGSVQLN